MGGEEKYFNPFFHGLFSFATINKSQKTEKKELLSRKYLEGNEHY